MGIDADDLVALVDVDDDRGIGLQVVLVVGAEGGDDDLVAARTRRAAAPFTCTVPEPGSPSIT